MLNHKELYILSKRAYSDNVEAGWWDKPRPFTQFSNLIHSEVSESLEGDRKSLKDDHLPHYDQAFAELADVAIRTLDYLGYCNHTFSDFVILADLNCTDFQQHLAEIHYHLSQAYYHHKHDDEKNVINSLREVIRYTALTAKNFWPELNFKKLIEEKMDYNKKRTDHSKEARNSLHGKKY